MRHILTYLWHGEDLGQRLFFGLMAATGVMTAKGWSVPETPEGWAGVAMAFMAGTLSKSEKEAKKAAKKV